MPRRAHQPHVGAGGGGAALSLLLLFLSPLVLASAAPLDVVPLPYTADKYKAIDAETMTLHHDKHYAGYVSKYNAAISANTTNTTAAITPTTPLPVALSLVNSPALSSSQDLNTAIRNQGGGAWNHALFWRTLSPLGANETRYATAASSSLKRAVDADFAGLDGLRSALSKAAGGVFGSGWAFLCATAPLYGAPGVAAGVAKAGGAATAKPAVAAAIPAPRLAVVTAPNQDSPLTGLASTQTERCIPIAGIDVWEHAYYLKYRNLRPAYIDAVLGTTATANTTGSDGLINWSVVSANYERIAKATEAGGDAALLAAAGEIGQA